MLLNVLGSCCSCIFLSDGDETCTLTGGAGDCKGNGGEWPLTATVLAVELSVVGDTLLLGTGDGFFVCGGVNVLSLGTGFL